MVHVPHLSSFEELNGFLLIYQALDVIILLDVMLRQDASIISLINALPLQVHTRPACDDV